MTIGGHTNTVPANGRRRLLRVLRLISVLHAATLRIRSATFDSCRDAVL